MMEKAQQLCSSRLLAPLGAVVLAGGDAPVPGAGKAALGDGKRASGLGSACWLCDSYTRNLKRSKYHLSGRMSQRVKPCSGVLRSSGMLGIPPHTYRECA